MSKNFARYLNDANETAEQFVPPRLRVTQDTTEESESQQFEQEIEENVPEITGTTNPPSVNPPEELSESTLTEQQDHSWAQLLIESVSTMLAEQQHQQRVLARTLAEQQQQQHRTAKLLEDLTDIILQARADGQSLQTEIADSNQALAVTLSETVAKLELMERRLQEMSVPVATAAAPAAMTKRKIVNRDTNGLILSVTEEISHGNSNT